MICARCGKPESDSRHIRYGNDLDNPMKHNYEPRAREVNVSEMMGLEAMRRMFLAEAENAALRAELEKLQKDIVEACAVVAEDCEDDGVHDAFAQAAKAIRALATDASLRKGKK